MSRHAQIILSDGRQLTYEIRPPTKAKILRLKITARDGLTAIAPKRLDERQVVELVSGKRDWITVKLDQFEEVRHLLGEQESARPKAFDLPALAESWRVEYRDVIGNRMRAGHRGRHGNKDRRGNGPLKLSGDTAIRISRIADGVDLEGETFRKLQIVQTEGGHATSSRHGLRYAPASPIKYRPSNRSCRTLNESL